jgi:hypothetical protein
VQHRTHTIIRAITHTATRIRPPRAIIRRRHITPRAPAGIRITGATTPARLTTLKRSGAPLRRRGFFFFDVGAEPFGGVYCPESTCSSLRDIAGNRDPWLEAAKVFGPRTTAAPPWYPYGLPTTAAPLGPAHPARYTPLAQTTAWAGWVRARRFAPPGPRKNRIASRLYELSEALDVLVAFFFEGLAGTDAKAQKP